MIEVETLPPDPESLDVLRARYPKALEFVYDVEGMQSGDIRPTEVAANVFDTLDGLRLIVARERLPCGHERLHIGALLCPGGEMAEEIATLLPVLGEKNLHRMWLAHIPERFRQLCGEPGRLVYSKKSSRWFAHFFAGLGDHEECEG